MRYVRTSMQKTNELNIPQMAFECFKVSFNGKLPLKFCCLSGICLLQMLLYAIQTHLLQILLISSILV